MILTDTYQDSKQTVLIVGGSRGLGHAISKVALNQAHRVYVLSRTRPAELCELGAEHLAEDFTAEGVAHRVLQGVKPNMLIICAAKGLFQQVPDINEVDIISTAQATFIYPIVWLGEAIKTLQEGSRLGWISSLTARIPSDEWAIYAASKAGVEHYIECIRGTAEKGGISITTCYPGCLSTDFHIDSGGAMPDGAVDPQQIAAALLSSVGSGEHTWVAPMDADIIAEIDSLPRRDSIAFGRCLR